MFGAWPHGRNGGGGGAPAKVPALTPAGFKGALAQWSCLWKANGGAGIVDMSDRSGNGNSLSDQVNSVGADIIPGQRSAFWQNTPAPLAPIGTLPALRLTGEITVYARVMMVPGYAGAPSWVALCNDFSAGAPNGNCLWSLLVHSQKGVTSANQLRYYVANGAGGTTVLFDSTALPPANDGLWHFVSMRRDVTGTIVTLGVDGVYETSGALLPPTGGSASKAQVGKALTDATDLFYGQEANVDVIGRRLSDAELLQANNIVMGL